MQNNVVIIDAGSTQKYYWHDVIRYKDLFFMLARRDVMVRYKQTAIGMIWAVLRPLLTMLVFTIVFGRIAKLPSEGVPYSLLVFSGMLPWFFFSSSDSESSSSLVTNAPLLSKVYCPRILIPASAVFVAVIDFLVGMCLLMILMIFFGFFPSWRLLLLPVFLMIGFSAALGLGLWFSTLNVRYRDVQFVIPFLLQFGLYLSPVGFSSSIIPGKWALIYALNPMVSVIDGFRWAILGGAFQLRWDVIMIGVVLSLSLLVSGIAFFRRFERGIVDVI